MEAYFLLKLISLGTFLSLVGGALVFVGISLYFAAQFFKLSDYDLDKELSANLNKRFKPVKLLVVGAILVFVAFLIPNKKELSIILGVEALKSDKAAEYIQKIDNIGKRSLDLLERKLEEEK